jgi:hypothetical protein
MSQVSRPDLELVNSAQVVTVFIGFGAHELVFPSLILVLCVRCCCHFLFDPVVCACATIPVLDFLPCFGSVARRLSEPTLDFFMRFSLSVLLCEYSGSISVIYSYASCSL